MNLDVVDLREFYLSPAGLGVKALLRRKIDLVWPDVTGKTVLGLGYATPLFRPWLKSANRLISFMPSSQGVAFWPKEGCNISALVDPLRLPLADESVDCVLMLHALESATDPEGMLREVWRVLKPEGKLLLLVAHRRGLWTDNDQTPFGTGRPYSSTQAKNLLKSQDFSIERKSCALHTPPFRSRSMIAFAQKWEPFGDRLFSAFGGLLAIEAKKQVMAPLLVKPAKVPRRVSFLFPCPSRPLPAGRNES
jgi:SAM-dependent methyltransferase